MARFLARRRGFALRRSGSTAISSPALKKAYGRITALQESTKRARLKAGKTAEHIGEAAMTMGAGFAAGVALGRFGVKTVFGLDWELLALGAGHLAAFFGVGGSAASMVMRSAANGVGALYAGRKGIEIGNKWAANSAASPGVSGMFNVRGPAYGSGGMHGESLAEDLAFLAR